MKIYTTGSEYSLYTNQLYTKLIEKKGYTVLVDKTNVSGAAISRAKNIYQPVEWKKKFRFSKLLSSVVHCLFSGTFYRDLICFLVFKKIKHIGALKDLQLYSFNLARQIEASHVAVTHHHYLDIWSLKGIDYLKPGTKILCSFWGSDLMDYSLPFEYQYQHRTLHKADLITVSSWEIKEQVLTKFGRELEPKIRFTQFVLNDEVFDRIEKNKIRMDVLENAKKKWGLPKFKLVVCVGNSMNVYVNHRSVLRAIQKLPVEIRNKIFLLVPASYGSAPAEYIAEINTLLKQTGCEYLVMNQFIDEEELSLLRIASDIFVHAPVSDAQSATALEVMLAGNLFLTGSFMPYSNFRKAGLKFFTFEHYNEIDQALADVVLNYNKYKEECRSNSEKVRKFFSPEAQIQTWLPVFQELEKM